jgi:hypothetical protein
MTNLSPTHGSQAQFQTGTAGAPGTPGLIFQYLNSTGLPLNRDKAEASAFHNIMKAYVAGLGDAAIPLAGPWDVNLDAIMEGLLFLPSPANNVVWGYGPTGIGAGLGPLYAGTGILTKYEIKSSISAANEWTGEMQNSGNVTRTIQ